MTPLSQVAPHLRAQLVHENQQHGALTGEIACIEASLAEICRASCVSSRRTPPILVRRP